VQQQYYFPFFLLNQMATNTTTDLLLERLAQHVIKQPTKNIFSFLSPGPNGGKIQRQLTYQDLDRDTSELAQRLLEAGLVKGER
jgi:acyl-CoA synthetase (AMP-forming)/AMP-acid ligase II